MPLLLSSVATSPHPPTLIVSGATASIRGSINWSVIAAGKSGGRILAQSLAREFGPKGLHVAHAVIDGGIDTPDAEHANRNDGSPDGKLSPYAVSSIGRPIFLLTFDADIFHEDCRSLLESAYSAQVRFHVGNRLEAIQREILSRR